MEVSISIFSLPREWFVKPCGVEISLLLGVDLQPV